MPRDAPAKRAGALAGRLRRPPVALGDVVVFFVVFVTFVLFVARPSAPERTQPLRTLQRDAQAYVHRDRRLDRRRLPR